MNERAVRPARDALRAAVRNATSDETSQEREIAELHLAADRVELLGTNRFVLGERTGMGQAAKLANQVMLAAALLGVAEGLTLARSLGLDAGTVLPIIGVSTGNSWAVQNWATARRWWEAYQPGTTLDILVKDLRSVQSCAGDAGLSLPVAAGVLERILGAWPPK